MCPVQSGGRQIQIYTSILLDDFLFFYLDIPFLLIKSLKKFDALDGGCSPPPHCLLSYGSDVPKCTTVSANYLCQPLLWYISISPFLSFLSRLFMTPPSSYFYFWLFISSHVELEKNLFIQMKSFWNKDEISFLNPLSVFQFIHFSTYLFIFFFILSDLPNLIISPLKYMTENMKSC